MSDLISREQAIDSWDKLSMRGRTEFDQVLMTLPSADKPQGEWIGEADGYADGELVYDTWYCSNCGYVVDDDEPPTWDYCPNCGSYNGGEQSD